MKLVLKRVEPRLDASSLDEIRTVSGEKTNNRPFALHTEDGQVLPCQISSIMVSEPCKMVELTVKFIIDGKNLRLEGDPAGE